MKKFAAAFVLTAALTFAGAANTYRIDLYQKTVLNGTDFKPGECKVELNENHVVLKQGKRTAETEVKVETSPNKFYSTSVGYTSDGRIQEIRLGGTSTKLLFDVSATSPVAGR